MPKLTTISQSVELLAKCSFELLISCMQGAPAQHLTVPFRLLRRQSVRQITYTGKEVKIRLKNNQWMEG